MVQKLDSLVQVLKAAGETTRMRMLALLSHGELSVKDFTEILNQSQPRISRHLKLLADAGLIERHAEGAWAYFALARRGTEAVMLRHVMQTLDFDDAQLRIDGAQLERVREAQRQSAAAYFAGVAESWDTVRSLHVPEAAVEKAILRHGATPVDVLIDLGTGTGRMLELLAQNYRQGIGIDSSREMISVARAKLSEADIAHAQIRQGDIGDLSEYAGKADRLILHQVLHYFDDPGQVLRSVARTLKPGGDVIIVDFAPHDLEFLRADHAHRRLGLSQEQMRAWAQGAGMEVASFEEFPHESEREALTVCLWVLRV